MTAATRTRSQIGRASRNKGATAERHLARWLRDNGWPHAERGRNNGFATAGRRGLDGYDIDGCPGLLWDCKSTTDRAWLIPGWLSDLTEAADAREEIGVLVVKRAGHADPGRWWAWIRVGDLPGWLPRPAVDATVPVCLELAHLAPLLRAGGYGTPIGEML